MKSLTLFLLILFSVTGFGQVTFERTYFPDQFGYSVAAYAIGNQYYLGGTITGQSGYERMTWDAVVLDTGSFRLKAGISYQARGPIMR